jgi:hypothetical protein
MLYDSNPTIDFTLPNKQHDETRQGEAFFTEVATTPADKFFYIESYGCAMNFSDSEIVASILMESGYAATRIILALSAKKQKIRCASVCAFSKRLKNKNQHS